MKKTPKNPTLSVHRKYKRRLNSLALNIDDFLYHANQKLDPATGGKQIHGRQEIEQIVAKAKELAALLPDPQELLDSIKVPDGLFQMFDAAAEDTNEDRLNAPPTDEEIQALLDGSNEEFELLLNKMNKSE